MVYSVRCLTDSFISLVHSFGQSASWKSSVTLSRRVGERIEVSFLYAIRGACYKFMLCYDSDLCIALRGETCFSTEADDLSGCLGLVRQVA
jgi:hypothetical protein